MLNNLHIETKPKWNISLQGVEIKGKQALVSMQINGGKSVFTVPCGDRRVKREEKGIVKTEYQSRLLNELLLSHSTADFCIVGKFFVSITSLFIT